MLVNASKKSQKHAKSHKNKIIVFFAENILELFLLSFKDSKWIVKCRKKSHKKIVVNFVIIIHVIFYYNSHLFTCKYEMIVK